VRFVLVVCSLLSLASVKFAFAQEPPLIDIISPTQGAIVVGPNVTVEVLVTDFSLVPPTGTDANPGEGHIIYFLDCEPPFVPGQPAIPDGSEVVYAATDESGYTFSNVAPGPHDVVVLLVLDNHIPAFPPAIDTVSFTVVAPTATPEPRPSPTPTGTGTATAPTATPEQQPSPAITETARSRTVEEETPTPTRSPSPTLAVLPAQVPAAGSTPGGAGPDIVPWLFASLAVGAIVVGSGVVIIRWADGRTWRR
jgi:hypothetical protein